MTFDTLGSLGKAVTHLTMLQNYNVSKAAMDKLDAKGKAQFEKLRAPIIAEYENMIRTSPDGKNLRQKITIEDFITMRENSHKRTLVEARINLMLMLLSMLFGMKGDDDKRYYTKNYATRRMMDIFAKLILETTFYMNPIEAAKLNKSAIPFMGLIVDAQKWGFNTLQESARLVGILEKDNRDKTPLLYYTSTFVPGGTQLRKIGEIFPQDKVVRH